MVISWRRFFTPLSSDLCKCLRHNGFTSSPKDSLPNRIQGCSEGDSSNSTIEVKICWSTECIDQIICQNRRLRLESNQVGELSNIYWRFQRIVSQNRANIERLKKWKVAFNGLKTFQDKRPNQSGFPLVTQILVYTYFMDESS